MKQEDKELLLKDLCARLPYGVKLKGRCDITTLLQIRVLEGRIVILTTTWRGEINVFYKENLDECKPYLRPMSSMTDEERMKIASMSYFGNITKSIQVIEACTPIIDYCYSRHLDIHGLIEKGLALEAPEGMYKIK